MKTGGLWQPPSGGCVLKLVPGMPESEPALAAAFGRLCVETAPRKAASKAPHAAAFGRLCVETDLLSPRRAAACKKENQMN